VILLAAALLAACTVTDGDTIVCSDERIRLLAIDAPEMPGHCRQGRKCVEGDPSASKRALERIIQGKTLTIERTGKDRYGRTTGVVYAGGRNTSCLQLAAGHARYWARYDESELVAKDCPGVAK